MTCDSAMVVYCRHQSCHVMLQMLLLEDSDHYDVYSDSEREEFLFRLFKHVCLGGAVCQYEDTVQPYLDVTKSLYKDLVRFICKKMPT